MSYQNATKGYDMSLPMLRHNLSEPNAMVCGVVLLSSLVMLGTGLCHAETPYSVLWDSRFSGAKHVLTMSNQHEVKIPDFCNESAMSQFPDNPSLFVGRKMQGQRALNGDGKTCAGGENIALQLYSMDWATLSMSRGPIILNVHPPSLAPDVSQQPTFTSGQQKVHITNAYDPAITQFNGEYWVAFECALETNARPNQFPWANVCLGPLDPSTNQLNLARTDVIVKAYTPFEEDPDSHVPFQDPASHCIWFAASVPKFLQLHGHVYLYWTMSAALPPALMPYLYLDAKGIELELRGDKLVPKGYSTYILTNKGVTVWPRDEQDPRSNGLVDISHVTTNGIDIFTVAAVGSDGKCPTIGPQILPDCYRLALARSTNPLNLNQNRIADSQLPGNANNYTRLIYDPSGNLYVLGAFFVPHVQTSNWVSSPPPVKRDPGTGNVSYVEYPEAVSPPLLIFPVPAGPRLSPAATVPLMTFMQ